MDILIKGATIATQNSEREILKSDIFIKENKIEEISKSLNYSADVKIDATKMLVIPGLINCHSHVSMANLRGLGEDLPLHEWLTKKIWPAEAKLSGAQIFSGATIGTQEMIRSGITAFNDMYLKNLSEIADAVIQSKIRGFLSRSLIDLIPGHESDSEWKESIEFTQKWKNHPFITPVVSAHSIYATSEDLIIKAKNYAHKNKLKFHIHVSETRKEVFDCLSKHGKRPLEYLDFLGVLDKDTILAHASWVTKKEIKLVGKAGATIVNCPVSNLKLATGGICQIREYDEENANVTLGTDGPASSNSLNMFETMKFASLMQKHHYWKADAVSVQRIFDFATINGAKALGLNSGSIEEGKLADVVLIDSKAPNMSGENILANLVFSAHPGNVKKVIVDGKIIF